MLQKEVGRMGFIITILASLVIMAIIAVSEFMKLRDSGNAARAAREKNSSISSSVYFGPKATELIKEKHREIFKILAKEQKIKKSYDELEDELKAIQFQFKGIEWAILPQWVKNKIEKIKEKEENLIIKENMLGDDYEAIYWGFAKKFKSLGLLPPPSPDSVME